MRPKHLEAKEKSSCNVNITRLKLLSQNIHDVTLNVYFPPVVPYTEQCPAGPSTDQYFFHHVCVQNGDDWKTRITLLEQGLGGKCNLF